MSQLDEVESRIHAEIEPRLEVYTHDGGYNCCGCPTYEQIVEDVLDIIAEVRTNSPV